MELRSGNAILKAVCESFGVTPEQISNKKGRAYVITAARMAYVYLLTNKLGISNMEVAPFINRDRRTVHRLINEHIVTYRIDDKYREKINEIVGERKKNECVFTVSETFSNKKKNRGYDGVARRKHMINVLVKKMIKDGMITVDMTMDSNYDYVYVSKLNIPKAWMESV